METGSILTLGQAHKLTGVAKGTLSKALKSGKLSYIDKTTAGYKIDRSELLRVFPLKPVETGSSERLETHRNPNDTSVLQVELKAEKDMRTRLEAEIDDLKVQRDEWMNQAKQLALPKPMNENAPVRATEKPRGLLARIFG